MTPAIGSKTATSAQSSSRAAGSSPLPELELRLSPVCPQALMYLGGFFLFIGVLFFLPLAPERHITLGAVLSVGSLGVIAGAYYLRGHLPLMGRMTQHQLILPRGVVIKWSDIISLHIVTFNRRQIVCFKLKTQIRKSKSFGKYDYACSPGVGWNIPAKLFIQECEKRMQYDSEHRAR
jgi:hypothetical protein